MKKQKKDYQSHYFNSPAVEIDESLFTHLVALKELDDTEDDCDNDGYDDDADADDKTSIFVLQYWILGIYDRGLRDVRMIAIGND